MKPGILVAAVLAVLVIGFGIYMIDVDVSGETELPDVDVAVEGGELPEAEVNTGSVSADTETVEVTVPDIDVSPAGDDDDSAQN